MRDPEVSVVRELKPTAVLNVATPFSCMADTPKAALQQPPTVVSNENAPTAVLCEEIEDIGIASAPRIVLNEPLPSLTLKPSVVFLFTGSTCPEGILLVRMFSALLSLVPMKLLSV